jgi:hypothetical protein
MAVSVSHRFVDEGTGRWPVPFLLNIGEMRVEVNRWRQKTKEVKRRVNDVRWAQIRKIG